jgi:hypothetical protein
MWSQLGCGRSAIAVDCGQLESNGTAAAAAAGDDDENSADDDNDDVLNTCNVGA